MSSQIIQTHVGVCAVAFEFQPDLPITHQGQRSTTPHSRSARRSMRDSLAHPTPRSIATNHVSRPHSLLRRIASVLARLGLLVRGRKEVGAVQSGFRVVGAVGERRWQVTEGDGDGIICRGGVSG